MASEANPVVYSFLLYEKDGEISQSKSGMWIKKISKGGEHVYSCIALHTVGNVTSLNNVTLTVNGKFCVVKYRIRTNFREALISRFSRFVKNREIKDSLKLGYAKIKHAKFNTLL